MQDEVVDFLATYRVTKLVIDDEITTELRDKAYDHLKAHPGKLSSKLEYLLSCPWCVSIWAGAGIAALRHFSPKTAAVVSTALAASAVTGLVYSHFE